MTVYLKRCCPDMEVVCNGCNHDYEHELFVLTNKLAVATEALEAMLNRSSQLWCEYNCDDSEGNRPCDSCATGFAKRALKKISEIK